MTGISEFVIRAWEKRYDAVIPSRTESNRRLYSEEDIEKLRLLNDAVQKGYNIGGIASLTINDLRSILNEKKSNNHKPLPSESIADVDSLLNSCIEAVKAYDGKELETLLLKASSKLSQPALIESLIVPLVYKLGELWHEGLVPLVYKLGELWHEGLIRVANEHLATAVIRSFLAKMIDQNEPEENAPIIISATPRGQDHELGAMIVAVTAAPLGWKVIYLGPNLPVEEIASVADSLEAKVVALSIVYPGDDKQLKLDFQNLKKMMPENINIIVGGRASTGYLDVIDEIGATHVKDTRQLRVELDSIRQNKYN